jgi:hypothetical protein
MQAEILIPKINVKIEAKGKPDFKKPILRNVGKNPNSKELTKEQIKDLDLKLSQFASLLANCLDIQNLFDHVPIWQKNEKMELTPEAMENKFRDIVHSQEFRDIKLPKYQISHRQYIQDIFLTNTEIMKHFDTEEITKVLDFLDKIVGCENRKDLIPAFKEINGTVLNFKQQVLAASLFIGSSQKLSSESETGKGNYKSYSKIESLENNKAEFIRDFRFTLPHIKGHDEYRDEYNNKKQSHTHFDLFKIETGVKYSPHIHLT